MPKQNGEHATGADALSGESTRARAKIPRLDLELRKLEAQASDSKIWSFQVPDKHRPVVTLPAVGLAALRNSFRGVRAPSERELLVFMRSNGVLPLIHICLENLDAATFRDILASHDNDVLRTAETAIEALRRSQKAWIIPPEDAALVTIAQYARRIANKNQDIFFKQFNFDQVRHFHEIIMVCATLLVTAVDDVERNV